MKKGVFDTHKDLFKFANYFIDSNPNMAYIIKLYACNVIHEQYRKDKACLNDNERKILESEIVGIKKIPVKGEKPDKNNPVEFTEFIENMFANVDEEDREGEVTMKTAMSFKMVGELIEVFNFFGEIPEEWKEKKKYCKFKAVNISKALKAGEVPRRGGPNDKKKVDKSEVDKEINDELKQLEKENEYENKVISINQQRIGMLLLFIIII